FLTSKYRARFDLTETQRYTLSSQTKKILRNLKKDIHVMAFYRGSGDMFHEKARQMMQDLLMDYAAASPKFTYEFVDPDKKPGVASKYGVTSYRTTLLISEGKQEIVGMETEEVLTNALLKLTRDKIKTIYFLKGHGENSILDKEGHGYKVVGDTLARENYAVKELVLLGSQEGVPDDAAEVVISGPQQNFLPDELDKLDDYIAKGGKLLVQLDPGGAPNLASHLSKYGFTIGNDIIIDKLSQVFGANYLTPVVNEYEPKHPLTQDFNVATFFPLARSVEVTKNPEKGVYSLASTSTNSWAETDQKALEEGRADYDAARDKKGPVSIAAVVAVEATKAPQPAADIPAAPGEDPSVTKLKEAYKKKYAKIVVFGDSDFGSNTHIGLAGNGDFFLNCVNWLAEEEDLVSIRPRQQTVTPMIMTKTQDKTVFWIPVVVMPLLSLLAGAVMIGRRRLRK
ncbi:MAG: GldG family protein, partial [Nitrospirota bacterium]|nr:GldG family protein [Nitrospirota bacterium]